MTSPVTKPSKSELPRDHDAREHAAQPALAAEEHRAGEIVALERARARALEAHLALLEEHGAVGDRERHVQRLLDDDDRHARAP